MNENKSTKCGERLYIDISYINKISFGGSKYWVLVVDEFSKMKWSFFIKMKNDLPTKIIPLLVQLINNGKHVKYICCDNAGKNFALKEELVKHNLNVNFEFTAPHTTQQNGIVERAFATLYGRVRAMLLSSRLSQELRSGLWTECALTATLLDNIMSNRNGVSPVSIH